MCNGHGMINENSTNIYDQCFCNHGYIGCDCTIRNTQENQNDIALIASTCVEPGEENPYGDGMDSSEISWDYLGLMNITLQIDNRYSIQNIAKTLRLWVAINVKIDEHNVWIEAIEEILPKSSSSSSFFSNHGNLGNDGSSNNNDEQSVSNYSISMAYYDNENNNRIEAEILIKEFEYLFNIDSGKTKLIKNDNQFRLYDIYNIKEPTSNINIINPSKLINFIIVIITISFIIFI